MPKITYLSDEHHWAPNEGWGGFGWLANSLNCSCALTVSMAFCVFESSCGLCGPAGVPVLRPIAQCHNDGRDVDTEDGPPQIQRGGLVQLSTPGRESDTGLLRC